MATLLANLSAGKGTWGHVTRIINDRKWDRVIIITNDFGEENFKPERPVEYIIIDPMRTTIPKITQELTKSLKEKIDGKEDVELNIISGTGKEHMAILSALTKNDINFKLIVLTGEGVINI